MSDPILKRMFNLMYPVGSVYLSTNSTSPAVLFGGTWTQVSGRFLYCTTTSKTTGGSTSTGAYSGTSGSTTLTTNQIPSHTHGMAERVLVWDAAETTKTDIVQDGSYDNAVVKFKGWSWPTSATGGGAGHTHSIPSHTHSQNLPPYFTVYCWYRTA